MNEVNHGRRIAMIWAVVAIIIELYLIVIKPPLGPRASVEGFGESNTMMLFFLVGSPIFVFVVVFLLYSAFVFRHQPGEPDDSAEKELPYARGSSRAVFYWSIMSLASVLLLAFWGIFTLKDVAAAPSEPGNGPPLVVQVIAQQWHFTYRYPSYGGVESLDLAVPANRPITFKITSLDVVHDFWIYDMDVKQDAVPGQTTFAYMLTHKTGSYWIVCDELCGIWHGYMHGPMYVYSASDFSKWIQHQQQLAAAVNGQLPSVSSLYYPDTPYAYPAAPQNSAQ